jgi:hypothetical protein
VASSSYVATGAIVVVVAFLEAWAFAREPVRT